MVATARTKKRRRRPTLPDRTLWDVRPGQQLLSAEEAAKRFGVSRAQFFRLLPKLRADWGLKVVPVGGRRLYLESSIDKILCAAAETETAICPVEDGGEQ